MAAAWSCSATSSSQVSSRNSCTALYAVRRPSVRHHACGTAGGCMTCAWTARMRWMTIKATSKHKSMLLHPMSSQKSSRTSLSKAPMLRAAGALEMTKQDVDVFHCAGTLDDGEVKAPPKALKVTGGAAQPAVVNADAAPPAGADEVSLRTLDIFSGVRRWVVSHMLCSEERVRCDFTKLLAMAHVWSQPTQRSNCQQIRQTKAPTITVQCHRTLRMQAAAASPRACTRRAPRPPSGPSSTGSPRRTRSS